MTALRSLLAILAAAAALHAVPRKGFETGPVRRTVLAIYNSRDEPEVRLTRIHRAVEMPLNHLGLVVRYWDINSGLPQARDLEPSRGVVTWFLSDAMPDPNGFIEWAAGAVGRGKRLVVMGDLGLSRDYAGRQTPLTTINHFLALIGLRNEGSWTRITYDARFVFKDPAMVEFERPLTGVLPPFDVLRKIDPRVRSYLVLRRGEARETESHLVVVGPNGGFVAEGYTLYRGPENHRMQLYVNPFEFFRLAFGLEGLPKPDATTLSGRRIFYSHVDGDGWRNMTEIADYKKDGFLSPRVILETVIKAYRDFPFTVAPIAADLDPEWYGSARSLELAREILAQPNVEAGSHTYSHPLNWEFFVRGDFAAEKRLARNSLLGIGSGPSGGDADMHGHELPRSYALRPFQLETEVAGSVALINALLPPGKKVETFQWSGDTLPFEAAVSAARAAGLRNINGGDTRLDQEYPSYAWVAPLGRRVGANWQIYASNSNENTYTDMWTDRYFGFKELTRTLNNTEKPRRIKPFNVYFHMYSGERLPSLTALKMNMDYARASEIIPITTASYCAIAEGFYSTEIARVDERTWSVENRGALQTVRFDDADRQSVDFGRSRGVIGQRRYQGSLYVALDESIRSVLIVLRTDGDAGTEAGVRPHLVHSRWKIWNVTANGQGLSFNAGGWGAGEMVWSMPSTGRYSVSAETSSGPLYSRVEASSRDGLLKAILPPAPRKPVRVTIAPVGRGR